MPPQFVKNYNESIADIMMEVEKTLENSHQSKTTTAKITNQIKKGIDEAIEGQEQTTASVGLTHTGETFEVAASKRTKNQLHHLDQIDLNLGDNVPTDIKERFAYGYDKVRTE